MAIRTFVAIEINAGPRLRRIIDQLDQVGPPVRIVRTPKLHLTLKFLGQTTEDEVPDLVRILDEFSADASGIDTHLLGLGAFPNRKKPRVIWTGIQESPAVTVLQTTLDQPLCEAGWPRDERPWRPHVTLARINTRRQPPPAVMFELLDQNVATEFGICRLGKVGIYRSLLTPQGPEYTCLHSAELS